MVVLVVMEDEVKCLIASRKQFIFTFAADTRNTPKQLTHVNHLHLKNSMHGRASAEPQKYSRRGF
jgi:hypothetical protein